MPSMLEHWPTEENPDGFYKFSSIWIEFSQDQFMIERQSYSVLEWLGDIGGLFDALRLIGFLMVAPFAKFWLKSELLSKIFRHIASLERRSEGESFTLSQQDCMKQNKEAKMRLDQHMRWDFSQPKFFKQRGYCMSTVFSKSGRYRRLIEKASYSINKELDFQKFLHR